MNTRKINNCYDINVDVKLQNEHIGKSDGLSSARFRIEKESKSLVASLLNNTLEDFFQDVLFNNFDLSGETAEEEEFDENSALLEHLQSELGELLASSREFKNFIDSVSNYVESENKIKYRGEYERSI